MIDTWSQKAPSAKRCIKTLGAFPPQCERPGGQKAPSAKRCIKTALSEYLDFDVLAASESTERQKVH